MSCNNKDLDFIKLTALPPIVEPNKAYLIKENEGTFTMYMTDKDCKVYGLEPSVYTLDFNEETNILRLRNAGGVVSQVDLSSLAQAEGVVSVDVQGVTINFRDSAGDIIDSIQLGVSNIVGLQDELDEKEDLINKVTDLSSPNNLEYPTTQAVYDAIQGFVPDLTDYVSYNPQSKSELQKQQARTNIGVYSTQEIQNFLDGSTPINGYNKTNWDTAFSWGDWSVGVNKAYVDLLGVDADTLDGLHASDFATSAQGVIADSALQPGDNISQLLNDVGYLTDDSNYVTLTNPQIISGEKSFIPGIILPSAVDVVASNTTRLAIVDEFGVVNSYTDVADILALNPVPDTPTLQEVTGAGNTTSLPINSSHFIASSAFIAKGTITSSNLGGVIGYDPDNDYFRFNVKLPEDLTDAPTAFFDFNSIDVLGSKIFTFPNKSGIVALLDDITPIQSQLTTHVDDASIHFTQAAINISESQITDLKDYLRGDINDTNGANKLTLGSLEVTGQTILQNGLNMTSVPVGTSDNILTLNQTTGDVEQRVFTLGDIDIANAAGVSQFPVGLGDQLRIQGSGDTSISFDGVTNTININSVPGSGTGGAVTSFNGRTGGVVSEAGDYSTAMVNELTNLYFTEPRVRATPLTGLTVTNTPISATNTFLQALGRLQGQINDRYTKGESDGKYSLLGHTHTFASITNKPTTLSGYGITDAYTKSETLQYFLRGDVSDTMNGSLTTAGNITVNGQFLTLSNTINHGIVTGADSQRLLIGGGSTWNGNNGAYISLEGLDYGGTGAGGDIHLIPASGGVVNSPTGLKISGISGSITNSNNGIMLRSNGSATILASANDAVYIRPVSDISTTGQLILNTSGTVVTSNSLSVTNNITATGNVYGSILASQGNGNGVRVFGTGVGNANVSFMSFYESNGSTRQGYVGFPSASHSTMYMRNDVFNSDIRLDSDGVDGFKFHDGALTRTVYHTGNLTSFTDGRYYTKGQSHSNYILRNVRTDGGYAWIRRSTASGGAPLYATQQGTGEIARFYQGAGDGTIKLSITNSGGIDATDDITTQGDFRAGGTAYFGDGKEIIRFSDAWLRLNPAGSFTNGIYCGTSMLRTDGNFQVGNPSDFSVIAGSHAQFTNNVRFYTNAAIQRYSHTSGYLEGSYQTVGANGANTNPIYIIGGNYTPTDTALSNMYGIGFAQASQASFLNATDLGATASGWGMYVSSVGTARVFLDASYGHGFLKGNVYAQQGVFRGDVISSGLNISNSGFIGDLSTTLTANRYWFMPNISGTVAMMGSTSPNSGIFEVGGTVRTTKLEIAETNNPPASSTAPGNAGEIRVDSNYIYVCTATSTWKRTPLSTW